ncbi:hypothetical protein M5K25_000599 [Dendrobium thyrsiflorum]|uniref:Uncharacterized protein n=1 Tax=Dendrobium thyrsiflorum TaxID=117978 RepID=A0ABD0W7K4_DENTH
MYNYLHVSIKGDLSTREASPTADNLGLPHPSAPVNEANITVSSAKKKRGPNRGVALEEFYRTKGKISILIPDGLNRLVGEHHSKLSREAGIIFRYFAPMQVERWDQISDADKEILLKKLMDKTRLNMGEAHLMGYNREANKALQSHQSPSSHCSKAATTVQSTVAHLLIQGVLLLLVLIAAATLLLFFVYQVKINLSIEESHVKDCVMHTMSKRFSDFCSKAYAHYKKHGGGMIARKSLTENLLRDRMIGFGYVIFLTQKHLRKLSRIELYKEEFTGRKEMKIIDDGGVVDETIICADVLGETSSYIRGLGYGPKLIKKTKIIRSNASSERETELESSLKVIQEKYAEQSKIIKSQQKTIDWLKMIAQKMGMQPPNDDGPDISNEENDD